MAQIAIKGHKTRGREVIEILRSLGGMNILNCSGLNEDSFYYIGKSGIICYRTMPHNRRLLTLEQFLEKFPYKVGDKVLINDDINDVYIIKSMVWNTRIEEVAYRIEAINRIEDNSDWFADEMELYKEQKIMYKNKFPYKIGTRISVKSPHIKKLATIVGLSYNSCACMQYEIKFDGEDVVIHYPTDLMTPITIEEQIKIDIPKGYKFANVDNQQVVFEKIKPQYPKTYEECCKVLFLNSIELGKVLTSGYNCELLKKLGELLICRDAYWKIAGQEMGLDKPWEPDWLDTNTQKYCIYYVGNEIKKQPMLEVHHFLAFPTAEMRDIFYVNFKDLIEACKDFL